jgi:hypothetical protein
MNPEAQTTNEQLLSALRQVDKILKRVGSLTDERDEARTVAWALALIAAQDTPAEADVLLSIAVKRVRENVPTHTPPWPKEKTDG